jgi:glycosyltransferase involved in cell wall biosynthesis/tetratricopeptide (TPR) repeat protein
MNFFNKLANRRLRVGREGQHPRDRIAAGWSACDRGDFNGAEQFFVEGLQDAPSDPDALTGLAHALQMQRRWDEALIQWQRVRELQPNSLNPVLQVGNMLGELGRMQEAGDVFSYAAQRWPDDPLPIEGLARLAHRRGDVDEEIRLWREMEAKSAPRAEILARLAHVAMDHDRLDDADKVLDRGHALFPRDREIGVAVARLAQARGDWQRALDLWTGIRLAHPDDVNAWLQSANMLNDLHRHDEALDILKTARDRWGESAPILAGLGRVSMSLNRPAAALEYWRGALALDPTDRDARKETGILLAATGQQQEGVRLLQSLGAELGDPFLALEGLARAADIASDISAGLRRWGQLAKIQPSNLIARIAVCRCLMQSGRLEEAQAVLRSLLPHRQEMLAEITQLEARLLEASGMRSAALVIWLHLTERLPSKLEPWMEAVRLQNALALREASASTLRQAIDRFPDSIELLTFAAEIELSLEHIESSIEYHRRIINILSKQKYTTASEAAERDALRLNHYHQILWLLLSISALDRSEAHLHEFGRAFPGHATVLEWQAAIAARRNDWPLALERWTTFQLYYPTYERGIDGQYQALMAMRRFVEAAALFADIEAHINFPEAASRFAKARQVALAQAARSVPLKAASPRVVFDITSLMIVLAAGAHPGGIERAMIEIISNIRERFRAFATQVLLIAWKRSVHLPIVVSMNLFQQVLAARAPAMHLLSDELFAEDELFDVSEGDTIVLLGSSWHYDPGNTITRSFKNAGAKIMVYIHDLLQLYYRTLMSEKWVAIFEQWALGIVVQSDAVMVNSDHSEYEVRRFCEEQALTVPPIRKVLLGDDYRKLPAQLQQAKAHDRAELLDFVLSVSSDPGFVLYVSGISKRKNHKMLVDAWRALRRRFPVRCPYLVLAGGKGDAFQDLVLHLEQTGQLGGHVVLLTSVSDAELNQLYEMCRFTVFPSICEGWGLPIAEALGHGKLCLASNTTSMPEVGGHFAEYFAPDDLNGFIALCQKYILDPELLLERESMIVAGYQRRRWENTARGVLQFAGGVLAGNAMTVDGPLVLPTVADHLGPGIIQLCPSWNKPCGIAAYTKHVEDSLRRVARRTEVVSSVEECAELLKSGAFSYLIVQHEYGLFDHFNASLAGPDSTLDLIKAMIAFQNEFPELRQAIIMHTIDFKKPDLAGRTNIIMSSSIPVYTMSSLAADCTRAIFIEHGIVELEPTLRNGDNAGRHRNERLTISSFGFLSGHKRVDRIFAACRTANAKLVANFACNDQALVDWARASAATHGIEAELTFGYQSDEEIIQTLQKGDVIYFPQGPISYWATTGSVRVAMNALRPIVVSPEDQFIDLAEAVTFATDATLPGVLRELGDPEVYHAAVQRIAAFRNRNTLQSVYLRLFDRLAIQDRHARSTISGYAKDPQLLREILAETPSNAAMMCWNSLLNRDPSEEEVQSFTLAAANSNLLEAVVEQYYQCMSSGRHADIDPRGLGRSELSHVFFLLDAMKLVPAVTLLALDGSAFVKAVYLEIAKRAPTSAESANAMLMLQGGDDSSVRKHFVIQHVVETVAAAAAACFDQLPAGTVVYSGSAVASDIQFSRLHYRLSGLMAFDGGMFIINCYRALLKRNPTSFEVEIGLPLSSPRAKRDLIAVLQREAANSGWDIVEIEEDIQGDEEMLFKKLSDLTGSSIHETRARNLAVWARQHLERQYPAAGGK